MLPRLASLLMTPDDIAAYQPLGVEESLDRYDQPDPTLTLAETSALAALWRAEEKYLRIEQERIPVSDAEQALGEARDHAALKFSGAACAMSWQAQVYPAAVIRAVVDEP